eukprot:TRINITY_DN5863_c0_g1_i1.p1 TRINITY_DN5863_c0_g1~~TRINITY_DN5863_c0_g1_i1.p1  ORF type:complete len:839 (+),score=336.05 TRINITY_DN5863_c0_g1_i1:115-2631(+)
MGQGGAKGCTGAKERERPKRPRPKGGDELMGDLFGMAPAADDLAALEQGAAAPSVTLFVVGDHDKPDHHFWALGEGGDMGAIGGSDCGQEIIHNMPVSPEAGEGLVQYDIRKAPKQKGAWVARSDQVKRDKYVGDPALKLSGSLLGTFWARPLEANAGAPAGQSVYAKWRPACGGSTVYSHDGSLDGGYQLVCAFLSPDAGAGGGGGDDDLADLGDLGSDMDETDDGEVEQLMELEDHPADSPINLLAGAELEMEGLREDIKMLKELGDGGGETAQEIRAKQQELRAVAIRVGALRQRKTAMRKERQARDRAERLQAHAETQSQLERQMRELEEAAAAKGKAGDKVGAEAVRKEKENVELKLTEERATADRLRKRAEKGEFWLKVWQLFSTYDRDGDGFLSRPEVDHLAVNAGGQKMTDDMWAGVMAGGSSGVSFEQIYENYCTNPVDVDEELKISELHTKLLEVAMEIRKTADPARQQQLKAEWTKIRQRKTDLIAAYAATLPERTRARDAAERARLDEQLAATEGPQQERTPQQRLQALQEEVQMYREVGDEQEARQALQKIEALKAAIAAAPAAAAAGAPAAAAAAAPAAGGGAAPAPAAPKLSAAQKKMLIRAKVQEMFDMYDLEGTGHWQHKEANIALQHLGQGSIDDDVWPQVCAQAGTTPEQGIPLEFMVANCSSVEMAHLQLQLCQAMQLLPGLKRRGSPEFETVAAQADAIRRRIEVLQQQQPEEEAEDGADGGEAPAAAPREPAPDALDPARVKEQMEALLQRAQQLKAEGNKQRALQKLQQAKALKAVLALPPAGPESPEESRAKWARLERDVRKSMAQQPSPSSCW